MNSPSSPAAWGLAASHLQGHKSITRNLDHLLSLVASVNHTLGWGCRVLLHDRPYGADLAEVRHLQVEDTDDIDGIDLLSGRHGLRHDCVDSSVFDSD